MRLVDPAWVRAALGHQAFAPAPRLRTDGLESTTFATFHDVEEVREDAVTVPIGRPIANTRVYVLDAWLGPVPAGVPGELYGSGDGLAQGYLKRPELTAERFVPDPFGAEPGSRLLIARATLVRWRADGELDFLETRRPSGEGPWLPDRAGRDRGRAARPARGARGGGAGA